MDRVLHFQSGEWELVEDFPERLDGHDVLKHGRQAALIVGRSRVPIVVESPRVLEGRRPDASEHVELELIALRGRRNEG